MSPADVTFLHASQRNGQLKRREKKMLWGGRAVGWPDCNWARGRYRRGAGAPKKMRPCPSERCVLPSVHEPTCAAQKKFGTWNGGGQSRAIRFWGKLATQAHPWPPADTVMHAHTLRVTTAGVRGQYFEPTAKRTVVADIKTVGLTLEASSNPHLAICGRISEFNISGSSEASPSCTNHDAAVVGWPGSNSSPTC